MRVFPFEKTVRIGAAPFFSSAFLSGMWAVLRLAVGPFCRRVCGEGDGGEGERGVAGVTKLMFRIVKFILTCEDALLTMPCPSPVFRCGKMECRVDGREHAGDVEAGTSNEELEGSPPQLGEMPQSCSRTALSPRSCQTRTSPGKQYRLSLCCRQAGLPNKTQGPMSVGI